MGFLIQSENNENGVCQISNSAQKLLWTTVVRLIWAQPWHLIENVLVDRKQRICEVNNDTESLMGLGLCCFRF